MSSPRSEGRGPEKVTPEGLLRRDAKKNERVGEPRGQREEEILPACLHPDAHAVERNDVSKRTSHRQCADVPATTQPRVARGLACERPAGNYGCLEGLPEDRE